MDSETIHSKPSSETHRIELNARQNAANLAECNARIKWIRYFESPNSNVEVFGGQQTHAAFIEICEAEARAIRRAMHAGNDRIVSIRQSTEILEKYRVDAVDAREFELLFLDKYRKANSARQAYKSQSEFAISLIQDGYSHELYRRHANLYFQWDDLLREIAGERKVLDENLERQNLKYVKTCFQAALYHVFLQIHKIEPRFQQGSRVKEMAAVAKMYGYSAISFRNFFILAEKVESDNLKKHFGSTLNHFNLLPVTLELENAGYFQVADAVKSLMNRVS